MVDNCSPARRPGAGRPVVRRDGGDRPVRSLSVGPGWWALVTAVAAGLVGGLGGFLGSLFAHRDSDLDRAASRYAAAQVALANGNEHARKLALIDLRELVRGRRNGV